MVSVKRIDESDRLPSESKLMIACPNPLSGSIPELSNCQFDMKNGPLDMLGRGLCAQ